MAKDGKFIITKDEATADALEAQGFEMINFKNGVYTFINDGVVKMNFGRLEKGTYKFTNKMNF